MFELRERASLLPVFCKNNEFNEGCNYSALKVVHILLLILALVMLFSRNNKHFLMIWLETRQFLLLMSQLSETVIMETEGGVLLELTPGCITQCGPDQCEGSRKPFPQDKDQTFLQTL